MARMKNPPHPGPIIRQECIEPSKLTVTETAPGVTRQTLNNVINEKAAISAEMSIRLSKAFGSTPEVRLGLQMEYELAQAAKESTLKCGELRKVDFFSWLGKSLSVSFLVG